MDSSLLRKLYEEIAANELQPQNQEWRSMRLFYWSFGVYTGSLFASLLILAFTASHFEESLLSPVMIILGEFFGVIGFFTLIIVFPISFVWVIKDAWSHRDVVTSRGRFKWMLLNRLNTDENDLELISHLRAGYPVDMLEFAAKRLKDKAENIRGHFKEIWTFVTFLVAFTSLLNALHLLPPAITGKTLWFAAFEAIILVGVWLHTFITDSSRVQRLNQLVQVLEISAKATTPVSPVPDSSGNSATHRHAQ